MAKSKRAEPIGPFGRGDDVFETPIPMGCDFVKKTQGGYGDEDGTGSQLPFDGQIDLVRTNLFRSQYFR
jgi:hypothetical protein